MSARGSGDNKISIKYIHIGERRSSSRHTQRKRGKEEERECIWAPKGGEKQHLETLSPREEKGRIQIEINENENRL